MVILPYAKPGIVGAMILGLGRAIGEAIAVTQVIGGFAGINISLFHRPTPSPAVSPPSTRAPRAPCRSSPSRTWASILLCFALIVNVIAR